MGLALSYSGSSKFPGTQKKAGQKRKRTFPENREKSEFSQRERGSGKEEYTSFSPKKESGNRPIKKKKDGLQITFRSAQAEEKKRKKYTRETEGESSKRRRGTFYPERAGKGEMVHLTL